MEGRTGTTRSTWILPHLFFPHPRQLTKWSHFILYSFFLHFWDNNAVGLLNTSCPSKVMPSPRDHSWYVIYSHPSAEWVEKSAYVFEVPKWHKLDNVSKHRLALGWPQDPIIAIQHLHVTKIGVPHPNDDDWHGKVRGMDNGLSGVSHVCDDAIRQDQQDEILLKLLDKKWKIISLVYLPKLLAFF